MMLHNSNTMSTDQMDLQRQHLVSDLTVALTDTAHNVCGHTQGNHNRSARIRTRQCCLVVFDDLQCMYLKNPRIALNTLLQLRWATDAPKGLHGNLGTQ